MSEHGHLDCFESLTSCNFCASVQVNPFIASFHTAVQPFSQDVQLLPTFVKDTKLRYFQIEDSAARCVVHLNCTLLTDSNVQLLGCSIRSLVSHLNLNCAPNNCHLQGLQLRQQRGHAITTGSSHCNNQHWCVCSVSTSTYPHISYSLHH